MRRLLAIAILSFLEGPAAQVGSVPDMQSTHSTPVREWISYLCGGAGPESLAAWLTQADAIVRVRIDGQFAYERQAVESEVLTELEVTVLDVFKRHPRGVGTGATMTITHPGGTIMRLDGPEVHWTNSFPPPPNGTEWFLFLRWDERWQAFRISYLEDGAIQVVDGPLVPQGGGRFAERWRGKEAEAFAEALRNGVTR